MVKMSPVDQVWHHDFPWLSYFTINQIKRAFVHLIITLVELPVSTLMELRHLDWCAVSLVSCFALPLVLKGLRHLYGAKVFRKLAFCPDMLNLGVLGGFLSIDCWAEWNDLKSHVDIFRTTILIILEDCLELDLICTFTAPAIIT